MVPDLHKPGGDDVPFSHHQLPEEPDEPPLPKLPTLNPRKLTTEATVDLRIPINGSAVLGTVNPSDSTERVEELGMY